VYSASSFFTTRSAEELRPPSVGGTSRCPLFLAPNGLPSLLSDVRFSNRPFGVKHFQTIHLCGVDVARGLVLLFGIGCVYRKPYSS
jgi:hypothetical protein